MTREFTIDDIENDPTFIKFKKKKSGLQSATITGYIFALSSFCNFMGKTPTEVHDTYQDDLRNRVAEFDMWLNDAFDEYTTYSITFGKTVVDDV